MTARWRLRKAFTLIELLIVTALLGMTIAAIAGAFSGGLRAWDAARTFGRAETEGVVALRMVRRDLMNTFPFYAVPFAGQARAMSFPCVLGAPADRPRAGAPGTVEYAFDPARKELLRRRTSLLEQGAPESGWEQIAEGVRSAEFRYASFAGAGGVSGWAERWDDKTNHPSAVLVRLTVEQGERTATIEEEVVPVPDRSRKGSP
jgi:prepilin-type N-terminal cleavage/methylation domain-containing protein